MLRRARKFLFRGIPGATLKEKQAQNWVKFLWFIEAEDELGSRFSYTDAGKSKGITWE